MLAEEKSQKYPTMPEVLDELKQMADIGFPVLAMGLVSYLKNMISVICMGRLGTLHLAAGSLAIGFTNITGYSVLSGLAMGMEPLCSQAFGSHNSSIAFLTLQRTVLILLFASFPIGILWLNLEPLMLVLHQNPEITRIAAVYCRFAVPDLVLNSLLHPLRIYLRNQGTTWLVMWCNLLAILLHVPITIFLTFPLDLGIRGIAISNFIANFNTLFFLLLYLIFCTRRTSSSSSSSSSSKEANLFVPLKGTVAAGTDVSAAATTGEEWGMLIKLAIPSCLGVCLEWWWYEFMTILTGYLYNPRIALATSGIVIQTTSLMYTLPMSLSAAVSTRVGHELGAGRPKKARLAAVVAIGLALVGSLMGLALTTIGRRTWGRVFTKDEGILELTMAVLPIIGLCELANCPQTTSCGILRGSARPGNAVMRLASLFLLAIATLVATGNTLAVEHTEGKITSSDTLLQPTAISNPDTTQTRRLRTPESPKDGEERRLVNVDLAIKDAVHEVRKLTKWKLQFVVWKGINKSPTKLIQEWGMKYPYTSDPRWAKIMAYQAFWGKGPLKYP